ncbi:MAG: adenosylcobinamide kinase / adenosylcobinamide-phosphate guanylyltransferase [Clostridiales bacterium]|nr:adenosylcobinamide kinase / adenosylcobinamide-phosphate guanylyltransferase [Clostridiales bacterium]
MRIFISGGCKNGKSTMAQKISIAQKKEAQPLYYVATMEPVDSEDEERILRHRRERHGQGFLTLEYAKNIGDLLLHAKKEGSFLLDSTTALLANEMFGTAEIDLEAEHRIQEDLVTIFHSIENIVVVSDAIYSDAHLFDATTKAYQQSLGHLDQICAAHCDVVLEMAYGNVFVHKGGDLFASIADRL